MPAATLTVSAPNCFTMRQLTTSPARRCAMPRRTAGASRTSATSAGSTGVPPFIAALAHAAEPHGAPPLHRAHGAPQLLDGLGAARGADRPLHLRLRDEATR